MLYKAMLPKAITRIFIIFALFMYQLSAYSFVMQVAQNNSASAKSSSALRYDVAHYENFVNLEGDINLQHPMVQFALNKLSMTMSSLDMPNYVINLRFVNSVEAQAYAISSDDKALNVNASDYHGLMYGLLEVNERLSFGQSIQQISLTHTPYLKKRGLKFNLPLDARTPSYDDTGDSAQTNIATVWDMTFWEAYLDRMAEHRYNQLTLWNPQPFTSMLMLERFPGLALDDVYVSNAALTKKIGVWGEAGGVSAVVTNNMRKVKTLKIASKIQFWRDVMAYAKSRGIDIHIVTWSIYVNGINGAHGIDANIDSPKTHAFFREAVKELVLTYPDLKGIGITAGENMPVDGEVQKWTREKWLWQTYGLGLADAKEVNPNREIDFMHRFWYSGFEDIQKYWQDYPDAFSFSFKYLMARMYSSPEPSHIAQRVIPLLRKHEAQGQPKIKTWWNLRNDDIFVYRWGDPEYAAQFIKNLPLDITEGIHMGSDGYVWAKTFSDKQIDESNRWEIDKHWYKFMIWGRLAYDPDLPKSFFLKHLAYKFPELHAERLYAAWQAASKIVPAVNRYQFQPGDRKFASETSSSRETFRYVNDFQVARSMPASKQINARQYVEAVLSKTDIADKISPLALAEDMENNANEALSGALKLSEKIQIDGETARTLADIKAFAYLGLYYANKIRSAVALEFFEKTYSLENDAAPYKNEAIAAIERAIVHWANYREISEEYYHPQLLARVNRIDWKALEKEVLYEKVIVLQKVTSPMTLPSTNDVDGKLKITYNPDLQGEERHQRLRIKTPDAGQFMVEVYEHDGVLINNYHSSGNGPMRWEWLQERPKGQLYYLNLKWKDINSVIKVQN
ncbi:hypothetical protein [Agaribacter marinus]|uniref:Glycosyl hydrolase family 20, domain 2 n=1 Tax=Agaribacter marinus TaxID=1431249 RepID=A0AA37SX28_9ALTE|nr:hypothetical protein [Agaribacter marinus]GLR69221.1 hypothetical protein GCM10007852_01290 [Agaribacter marinus]